jgi:hypothetical protein
VIRYALPVGLAALAAWVVGLLFAAKAALLGWLVAVVAFASVPVGCLAVLMMVVLVPGTWRRLYTGPLLLGSALLPIAAIAAVPVVLGMGSLYSWTDPSVTAGYPAFKAAWLSPAFFAIRQVIYWGILIALWLTMLIRPALRLPLAAIGLIIYALIASWMEIDLAETITPDFHSSIYGLLMLAGGWVAAIGFALAVGLAAGRTPAPISAAGAFFVAMLMWAYLHAMQFLVIWSGDLPDEVGWYVSRGTHGWEWVTALLYLGQATGPFFALLMPAVRNSRRPMIAIGLLTLALRPVESAWFILPQQTFGWPVWLLVPLALLAIGGLGAASLVALKGRRPEWFRGDCFVPGKAQSSRA